MVTERSSFTFLHVKSASQNYVLRRLLALSPGVFLAPWCVLLCCGCVGFLLSFLFYLALCTCMCVCAVFGYYGFLDTYLALACYIGFPRFFISVSQF